jgi:segregation and condensation protein A
MAEKTDYKIELEVFEGPLDLLLYLIKKEELDIYDIPIEKINKQYMDYLDLMRMLDLDVAGEFLVMAATLMMIKSRMLLPIEERPELDEDDEDPRWDLVKQLVEYKKFKDIASKLHVQELEQENIFDIGQDITILDDGDDGVELADVSLYDLISAFNNVLKRAKKEVVGDIFSDQFTVAQKIDELVSMLRKKRSVQFYSLFTEESTKHEIVCTFLALLELIKMRKITIYQESQFSDIMISSDDAPEEEFLELENNEEISSLL